MTTELKLHRQAAKALRHNGEVTILITYPQYGYTGNTYQVVLTEDEALEFAFDIIRQLVK